MVGLLPQRTVPEPVLAITRGRYAACPQVPEARQACVSSRGCRFQLLPRFRGNDGVLEARPVEEVSQL